MQMLRVQLLVTVVAFLSLACVIAGEPAAAQTSATSQGQGKSSFSSSGFPTSALGTPTPTTDLGGTSNPVSPGGEIYDPNVDYKSYVLGPGDVVSVKVMPQDKYSATDLPVLQDGSLYYPGVGRLDASGKTIDQLASDITVGLSRYCVNPSVTISLSALRLRVIYITGGVNQPKVLDASAASTLAKAITLADGARDIYMLSHVAVIRGQHVLSANMYDLLIRGVDNGQNLPLQAGDIVIVPLNTARVTVLGAVDKPGQYPLDQTETSAEGPERLADAISTAGGVERAGAARIAKVGLLRQVAGAAQPQLFVYDYGKYLKDGDESQNPIIQDNDVVVVPEAKQNQLTIGTILTYIPYYAFLRQVFP
jgi:protein involved in polysaccharide export with SLBB domain